MAWNSENNRSTWIGIFCLILGFSRILFISLQTEYVNGWDGYYYVMQIHSWFTYGNLQSLDYSLIYPYFGFIHFFIPDYEFGHKFGTALLGGVLIWSSYHLTRTITPKPISILVPIFLIFSPTYTYLLLQFPKNALGLIFLILMIRGLLTKNQLFTFLFIILSLLTHRVTGLLALVLFGISIIRHVSMKVVIPVAIVTVGLSLLPGILHISDFERLTGQFQVAPQFSPISFNSILDLDTFWHLELGILSIIIGIILFQKVIVWHSLNSKRILLISTCLILLFPFYVFEAGSLGFRLFLLAPAFLLILIVMEFDLNQGVISFLSGLLLILSLFSMQSYKSQLDPPNQQFELIANRLTTDYSTDDYPIVIARKSLAEMIIYKTDFDALNWSPPHNANHSRILRIVNGLEYFDFKKHLNLVEMASLDKLSLSYYAIPEETWNKFILKIAQAKDQKLMNKIASEGNPIENRPLYLTRGKPNKWKN
jgi:hypothetical protein